MTEGFQGLGSLNDIWMDFSVPNDMIHNFLNPMIFSLDYVALTPIPTVV